MFFSESSEAELENGLRVAVMGGAACGKTSILNQYLHQVYKDRYWVTTGEIHETELEVGGKKIQLDIWDTPGGYCFDAARQRAIRVCDAFILVFAVNKPESFDRLVELGEEIREKRGTDVPIVVAATKTDLALNSWFHGAEFMSDVVKQELKCSYFEVTARVESGISDIFYEVVNQRQREKCRGSRRTRILLLWKSVKKILSR